MGPICAILAACRGRVHERRHAGRSDPRQWPRDRRFGRRGSMLDIDAPAVRRPPVRGASSEVPARMTALSEAAILDALRRVQEPELGRDIVTLEMVKSIAIDGSSVAFTIDLTTPACPLKDEI